MNNSIVAGIVTYNPNIELLNKNLNSIVGQVHKTIVIDNGSCNALEITKMISYFNDVELILNKSNKGIAAALNQIGDFAKKNKCDFFLTLDQDSISSTNLVENLFHPFKDSSVGMTCPYIDRYNDYTPSDSMIVIKSAITSGSLVRLSCWEKIGGFWEFLFIDEVDHEFSYQIRKNGFNIIQCNSTAIKHMIGDPFVKVFMGHTFHPTNHSPFRRYYIARNDIIIKHLYPNESEPFDHRYLMLFKIIISILFCEKDKLKKICAIFKGIIDGVRWNIKNNEIISRRETL